MANRQKRPSRGERFSRNRSSQQRSAHSSEGHRPSRRSRHPDDDNQSPVRYEDVIAERLSTGALKELAERASTRINDLLLAPESKKSAPATNREAGPTADATGIPDRGFARAKQKKKMESSLKTRTTPHTGETGQPLLSSLLTSQTQPQANLGELVMDPWQAQALDMLLDGRDLVVDAPTTAGKTRIIEAYIDIHMNKGLKLIYTSPVKSLSNDKYREFCDRYGKEKVGINTGDFKENLRAPIVLATLETYRNSLLGVEPRMDRAVVVYDEYHYLQDEGRGSAWEESIILTPKMSQLVLLSASVPNAGDFAEWITSLTGKPCEVIRVKERPVPLVDLVYTEAGWVFGDDLNLRAQEILELQQIVRSERERERRQGRVSRDERFRRLVYPVESALSRDLGPCVIYAGRRADIEAIAKTLASSFTLPWDPADAARLRERIETLPGWDYLPSEVQRLIRKFGIAYHHSGLIPPGRVAIETLLKEGYLRVCTGTMGISLGVNFAVRSAVVADESRPGDSGETRYSHTEILQMLGRAGRRGRDRQGFSLWINLGRYALQKPGHREPCRSSLKYDPTTVLGILGQHESLPFLSEFYRKSFFLRGRDPREVLLKDHDLLFAMLYKEYAITETPCQNIPATYARFLTGKRLNTVACSSCELRPRCHDLQRHTEISPLQVVVSHLQHLGALDGHKPSFFGQLARHFPQSGGMIIAKWVATSELNDYTFDRYVQAMACFCGAQHKEIPDAFVESDFLDELDLPALIDEFYPLDLFPDLYDDLKPRGGKRGGKVFREFNRGAASVVSQWLHPETTWKDLVETHETKTFSPGDCMMVLFRFATLLQSCTRIADVAPGVAGQAEKLRKILLREPLDARNRMLMAEVGDAKEEEADKTPS